MGKLRKRLPRIWKKYFECDSCSRDEKLDTKQLFCYVSCTWTIVHTPAWEKCWNILMRKSSDNDNFPRGSPRRLASKNSYVYCTYILEKRGEQASELCMNNTFLFALTPLCLATPDFICLHLRKTRLNPRTWARETERDILFYFFPRAVSHNFKRVLASLVEMVEKKSQPFVGVRARKKGRTINKLQRNRKFGRIVPDSQKRRVVALSWIWTGKKSLWVRICIFWTSLIAIRVFGGHIERRSPSRLRKSNYLRPHNSLLRNLFLCQEDGKRGTERKPHFLPRPSAHLEPRIQCSWIFLESELQWMVLETSLGEFSHV